MMPMKNKDYIIFDLDGTLVDSYPTIINACKRVLKEFAPSLLPSEQFFNTYLGKEIEQLFIDMAKISNLSLDEFRRKYDEQYAHDFLSGSSIINKQFKILTEAKAKGIGIIVLTNKKQELAERVCEKLLGNSLIDIIIGRKDSTPIKPRHVIIERLHDCGIKQLSQCIKYYGDSKSDLETAQLLRIEYINTKFV